MLYEIPHIRQDNHQLIKRWFTSKDMDLFVWVSKTGPVRFQLSFNKGNNEQAVNWDLQKNFQHYRVDSGENNPDQYKKTPILTRLHQPKKPVDIAWLFLLASDNVDIDIANFIYSRLLMRQ